MIFELKSGDYLVISDAGIVTQVMANSTYLRGGICATLRLLTKNLEDAEASKEPLDRIGCFPVRVGTLPKRDGRIP